MRCARCFCALHTLFILSFLCHTITKQKKIKIMEEITKFTLYLGLSDKDTKVQEISTLEAYKIVSNLISADFGGGTIFEARGIFRHADNVVVEETTLRIELLFTTGEKVRELVATLKKLFNQESIAVQREVINSELW